MSDKTLLELMMESLTLDCIESAEIFGVKCDDQKDCSVCERAVFSAIADAIEREYLPRPRLLDAEKVPINVGDTVWNINTGECRTVDEVGDFWFGASGYAVKLNPLMYSHKQPDSLERIEEDALMASIDYCDKYGLLDSRCNAEEGDGAVRHCTDCGLTCEERMTKHLLRRQREVLERDHER